MAVPDFIQEANRHELLLGCLYNTSAFGISNFLLRNISIPSVEIATLPIHWCGTAINVPISYSYGSNNISMSVLADKKGSAYKTFYNLHEGTVEIGVISGTNIVVYTDGHHWTIKDVIVTNLGEISFDQSDVGFVNFTVTISFTDIIFNNSITG